MRNFLFAALMAVSLGVFAAEPNIDMDSHLEAEAAYWLNGTPNDHQRYSALCGVYRQNPDDGELAVIYVTKMNTNGTVEGTPVANKEVVGIITNDMDYLYGALVISKMCGDIPSAIAEATAQAISDGATSPTTKAFIGTLMGTDVNLP